MNASKEEFRVNNKYERHQRSASINNSMNMNNSSNRQNKIINKINAKMNINTLNTNPLNTSANNENPIYTLVGEEIPIDNNTNNDGQANLLKPIDFNENLKNSDKRIVSRDLSQTVKDSVSVIDVCDVNTKGFNVLSNEKNDKNMYQTGNSLISRDDLGNTPNHEINLTYHIENNYTPINYNKILEQNENLESSHSVADCKSKGVIQNTLASQYHNDNNQSDG